MHRNKLVHIKTNCMFTKLKIQDRKVGVLSNDVKAQNLKHWRELNWRLIAEEIISYAEEVTRF